MPRGTPSVRRHRPGAACAVRKDQRGQTSVLIIGFTVVVAMAVVVVVDATAGYLQRQALSSLADGVALAAVDGIEGEAVYTHGLDGPAAVDPEAARALADEHLVSVGAAGRFPGLRRTVETDGERVVVRLAAPLDLPLPLPGVGDQAYITGTAAAVVRLVG